MSDQDSEQSLRAQLQRVREQFQQQSELSQQQAEQLQQQDEQLQRVREQFQQQSELSQQQAEQLQRVREQFQQQSEQLQQQNHHKELQQQLLNALNGSNKLTMEPNILETIMNSLNTMDRLLLLRDKIPAILKINYRAYFSLPIIKPRGSYADVSTFPRGTTDITLCNILFDITPVWTEEIDNQWFDERFAALDEALLSKNEKIIKFANDKPALIQELDDLKLQKFHIEQVNGPQRNEELNQLNGLIHEKTLVFEERERSYQILDELHNAVMACLGASVTIDESESSRVGPFYLILTRIIQWLLHPFDISISSERYTFTTNIYPGKRFQIETDIQIVYGSQRGCFIEIKKGRLRNCIASNGDLQDSGPITSLMKEMVQYFIGYKTTFGFLSDLETTILVNFDVNHFDTTPRKGHPPKRKKVPFKYRIIKLSDTIYTLQAIVVSTIYYQAKVCDKLEQERVSEQLFNYLRKKNNVPRDVRYSSGSLLGSESSGGTRSQRGPGYKGSKRKRIADSIANRIANKRSRGDLPNVHDISSSSPDNNTDLLRWYSSSRNDFTILQSAGDHLTEVFQFTRDKFVKNFPDIKLDNSNSDIIVKLYDFASLKDYYLIHKHDIQVPFTYFRKAALEGCEIEIRALNKIKSYNLASKQKINSPVIYGYGEMVFTAYGPAPPAEPYSYRGLFIIMSYIEDETDQVITENLLKQGVKQIKLLGKIGISQNDIARRNVLVNQGKVYIIDFSHAIVEKHVDYLLDISDMEYLNRMKCTNL